MSESNTGEYRPWSSDEDAILIAMLPSSTYQQIADRVGRTREAVRRRRNRLNLDSRPMYPTIPAIERFLAKVVREPNGCWVWTAAVNRNGYGVFFTEDNPESSRPRLMLAHRWAYEYWVGPIPAGLQLDHLCRIRACVNPEHLEPVTARENTLRGESFAAQRARQAHCKRGHAFSPDNTIWRDGLRTCRECQRQWDRERRRG